MKTARGIQSGARASARFTVHNRRTLKLFSPLSLSVLKRRERRAPVFLSNTQLTTIN
jgi:hypothetical protein